MISFQFDIRLALKLIISFIIFTFIGTITHELGHISVAKYFGRETILHYGSMNSFQEGYLQDTKVLNYKLIVKNNIENLKNRKDFRDKEEFLKLKKYILQTYPRNELQSILITLGGPIETMLTSIIGLFFLSFRKSKDKIRFQLLDWLGLFLSLFALREVSNFVRAIFSNFFHEKTYFRGDEFVISRYLEINQWLIPLIMAGIGSVISVYVIFKILPLKYRLTFIISGCVGGVSGFLIWFGGFGKMLIP